MCFLKTILSLAALALASPAVSEEPAFSPLSAEETDQLASAMQRGAQIYRYDQAAWHTTDAMREDVADLASSGIRGWVVTPHDEGHEVVYWKRVEEGFAAVYSAVYDGSAVVNRTVHDATNAALRPEQVRLIEAQLVPDTSALKRCSDDRFNTVTMPSGKANGSVFVYFLTPQKNLSSLPMGGHHRLEVLDREVVHARTFTKSCLTLDLGDDEKKPAALMTSHILDQVPTEMHAFSVYVARIPVYVGIVGSKRLFAVEIREGAPSVRLLDPR